MVFISSREEGRGDSAGRKKRKGGMLARLSLCGGSCGTTSSKNNNSTPRKADLDYEATSMHDAILDVQERREIARILPYLNDDDERVLVVATQSRVLPGATFIFTPDTIFCTTHRTIIRNPMLFGLREHVDYYRHRDVKSVRMVRGRWTSSLMLTVPGMGTAARSASGTGDGVIKAIPHDKAESIYRIIQGGGRGGRGDRRGNSGSGADNDDVAGVAARTTGDRRHRQGEGSSRVEVEAGMPAAATATAGGAGVQ